MGTPSHRTKMTEPVKAITTYTETPVQQEKPTKKPVEPKKEDK